MAAAAVLIALTTEGVLASSSVSGRAFEVGSRQLKGTGFEQFGGAVTSSKGTQHPVAVSAIGSASLANLCQSISVGPVTLRITAGGWANPVSRLTR